MLLEGAFYSAVRMHAQLPTTPHRDICSILQPVVGCPCTRVTVNAMIIGENVTNIAFTEAPADTVKTLFNEGPLLSRSGLETGGEA